MSQEKENYNEKNANYINGTEMVGLSSSQMALTPDIAFERRRCNTKRWLAVFLVIFLIAALVFAGLFAYEKLKPKGPPVCLDESCVSVSSGLMKSMNTTIDPCDDFYQYACGGWETKNLIPDTRSSWSQFRILSNRNEELLKKLINSKDIRDKYKDNPAVMKAFDYYDACMDEKLIEKLGQQPLQDLIKMFGSWNVTNKNWTEADWDFMKTFVMIQRDLSIAPWFNMFVGTDLKDSTKTVIVFDQSGTILSREAMLFNTTYHAKIRTAYRRIMTSLMEKLGAGNDAEARMEEVYQLELELAKNTIPKEQRRDSDSIYNKMTLAKLASQVDSKLNLTDFLGHIFNLTDYNVKQDTEVVVYAMEYMVNMSRIFANTPKRIVANYMMWHVAYIFASSLSKEFRDLYYEYREAITGTRGEDPRWQDCTSGVSGTFGMAIGLLFVDQTFKKESKTSAERMIKDIRNVFIDNLQNLNWMDEKTRKVAKEKAEAIRENIGYPDFIKNKTALELEYSGQGVDKTKYFWNQYERRKFYNQKNLDELGKPVDKTKWSMNPPTVNAYYSSTDNKIVFPAGILQDPFYEGDHPNSLNYGGIGMVVGHEITHGFDDNGRKFNKDGNLLTWWTNNSIEAFKKKTDCLVKQYSSYEFHGKKLNGLQTLGENIADNGGIKQSFQAYQKWKKDNNVEEEKRLPGLEKLSHDQLFFLSFAQIWCSAYRPEAAIRAIENGVHSPGKLRVIGSLSNSNEFAEAWKCPVGSRMNPKDKCAVW
ncbi:endothelin-converting enzyme homolog isoform X2 [Nematostella vectensis]|uniref:endothelin-converting enzyme homolog isoform X2 n=1 Tax=Nematostella vectensis TaxID=45351 RepID=UPI002076F11A|nr:endothelin-converting enzyme homolog isoform X2 [Nematostella vectensis]